MVPDITVISYMSFEDFCDFIKEPTTSEQANRLWVVIGNSLPPESKRYDAETRKEYFRIRYQIPGTMRDPERAIQE